MAWDFKKNNSEAKCVGFKSWVHYLQLCNIGIIIPRKSVTRFTSVTTACKYTYLQLSLFSLSSSAVLSAATSWFSAGSLPIPISQVPLWPLLRRWGQWKAR